jgi:hypothetical protein
VADWVLGPVLDVEHEDPTSEGAAPKLRLIPCPCQERIGPSGPDGVWHGTCAGCSARIEITLAILQQDWMARAGGAQQVLLLCPDCTRTATTLTQFLRWKRQRLAHTWVLNILKEDGAIRDRWANIRKLLAGVT